MAAKYNKAIERAIERLSVNGYSRKDIKHYVRYKIKASVDGAGVLTGTLTTFAYLWGLHLDQLQTAMKDLQAERFIVRRAADMWCLG